MSINSASTSIDEGEMAKFIVTASTRPGTALQVKYIPTDVSGSYLDTTANPTGVRKNGTINLYPAIWFKRMDSGNKFNNQNGR